VTYAGNVERVPGRLQAAVRIVKAVVVGQRDELDPDSPERLRDCRVRLVLAAIPRRKHARAVEVVEQHLAVHEADVGIAEHIDNGSEVRMLARRHRRGHYGVPTEHDRNALSHLSIPLHGYVKIIDPVTAGID